MRLTGAALLLALAATGCGSSGAHARLTATPVTSLVDATVHLRLTGAKPGETVTLLAREGRWTSRAVFRADGNGSVDPARDPATGGAYRGRDAMGLFWSMDAPGHRGRDWPGGGGGGTVRLEARTGGRTIASTRIRRRIEAPDVTERDATLARDGFVGRYFAPARPNGIPVLIFGGSGGGILGLEPQLLASHGFPTLAIAYFGAPGLPRSLVRIPLEYFVRAIRWLDRQPGVDPGRLVVSGVSRGSEPALLLGAHFPGLVHAVVALTPSSTVVQGLPPDRSYVPAWTLHGKPIPIGSRIPVERIRGPLLVAAGTDDHLWGSLPSEQSIVASRRAAGEPVTGLVYRDAGHGIGLPIPTVPLFTQEQSRYGPLDLGGTRAADAHARADLWPRLLRFLRGA